MIGRCILTLALLILVEESRQGAWWEDSKAVSLDTNNFDALVWKEKHYVVEFYSTNCYWCERLASDWNRLAEHYGGDNPARGDVIVAKVNAPANNYLGYKFHIAQYPTVLLMKKGDVNKAVYYPYERTFDRIRDWIESETGPEEKPPTPEPTPAPIPEPQVIPDPVPEPVREPEPVPVQEPEPIPVHEPLVIQEPDSAPFLSTITEPPVSSDDEVDRKIKALVQEPSEPTGDGGVTSLSDCSQESIQMIYDQYTFALTQKTAYDDDFTSVKEKLNAIIDRKAGGHLFRDLIFFSFGLAIGVGCYVTYRKVVSVGHLYQD
jgi:thiol-disulfide isomerase/thioredoxin